MQKTKPKNPHITHTHIKQKENSEIKRAGSSQVRADQNLQKNKTKQTQCRINNVSSHLKKLLKIFPGLSLLPPGVVGVDGVGGEVGVDGVTTNLTALL